MCVGLSLPELIVKRSLQFFLLMLLTILNGVSVAEYNHIQFSTNLQEDGALAATRGVPLMLMISAEECPYCKVMESDYLVPLLRNRAYDSQVLIRKIHLDSFDDLVDFSGNSVAATDISQRYGVWVTPTLLFLNGNNGEEVQKRMVGLGVRDFVSAFIDQSIFAALKMIR